MTMKPEYNYGVKTNYIISLYAGHLGDNIKRLKEICYADRLPAIKWGTFKSLDHNFDDGQLVWIWHCLTEDACFELAEELDEIGVKPEICGNVLYSAFQNEVLMADFAKRYPGQSLVRHSKIAQLNNDLFSQVLSDFQEYSLKLWAVAENIEAAYRLTIMPSFSEAQVVRLWSKNNETHFVNCIAGAYSNCKLDYKYYDEDELQSTDWQKIQTFMLENFWTNETWYSHYGSQLRDGTIYLFEGWHNGRYKLLDDHSPGDKNSLSSQAIRLFQSLIATDRG